MSEPTVEPSSAVPTVLVTGGTGFLGGWCIVALLRGGYRVRTTVRDLRKADSVRTAVGREVDPGGRLSFAAADLGDDAGWPAAVAGCDYVLHVASPPGGRTETPDELVAAAREGSLRVLRAAAAAGVRRVVLTSSCAAAGVPNSATEVTTDETVWTDPEQPGLTAYRLSKTLAERAAWDFVETLPPASTTLTTILPGAILGPVLGAADPGSVQVIGRLVTGKVPGSPRIELEVVDVRDLGDLHVEAMTSAAAAGERFIARGDPMLMPEIAATSRPPWGTEVRGCRRG